MGDGPGEAFFGRQCAVGLNRAQGIVHHLDAVSGEHVFDPVGIATMQFSNDNVFYSAEEPYATTKAWQLDAGDGFKTVYVRFKDAVGTISPIYSDTIILQ